MGPPVRGGDVDEEGAEQFVGYAFVLEEQLHVVEIPGVLSVQGGDKLDSVEVLERDQSHLGDTELVLDAWGHAPRLGCLHRAAHPRGSLDLDGRIAVADLEPDLIGAASGLYPDAAEASLHALREALQGGVDAGEGLLPVLEG